MYILNKSTHKTKIMSMVKSERWNFLIRYKQNHVKDILDFTIRTSSMWPNNFDMRGDVVAKYIFMRKNINLKLVRILKHVHPYLEERCWHL